MRSMALATCFALASTALAASSIARAGQPRVLQAPADPPYGRADAIVDLASADGAALVKASWRYRDAKLVEVDARAPGLDLRASGAPTKALDLDQRVGTPEFDAADGWRAVAPDQLVLRRGTGHISFGWYRLGLTLPARIGDVDVRGATIAFEIVVDDYAELWVNGKQVRALGQRGGSLVAGFNAPNRVVLTHAAVPGQRIDVAVLAANGPFSAHPENFLWVRSATLDVYRARPAQADSHGTVVRLDPALDRIVPRDARIELLASGFEFTEGPVWSDGALLFSDPNANTIYRYDPAGRVSVYRVKSGYAGADIARYRQPGSNGLAIDREGRLTIDQHGARRVIRVEPTGAVSVLAERYQGKRLNSPNDLVYRSDGSLYFTDPPFGLPAVYDDPGKELAFSGVYRVANGTLELLSNELAGPNGIAFSPDERFLYVGNWDPRRKVVLRYPVLADGKLGEPVTFYDVTALPGDEAIDGLKVDAHGNVFVSAPGGVHVVSPSGKHLGTLAVDEPPANFAWGDADGRTLYMTAHTGLYRIRLAVPGARFGK